MTAWLSAAEITSKVRRRRVRRSLAAGAVVLAVAGTITGLAVGNDPRRPSPVAEPRTNLGSHVRTRIGSAVELVANSTPLEKLDPAAAKAVSGANEALTVALLKHASLLADEAGR